MYVVKEVKIRINTRKTQNIIDSPRKDSDEEVFFRLKEKQHKR